VTENKQRKKAFDEYGIVADDFGPLDQLAPRESKRWQFKLVNSDGESCGTGWIAAPNIWAAKQSAELMLAGCNAVQMDDE
jgi:hypothetical protein